MSSIREIAEKITTEVAKICGCNWESCTRTRNATTDAIEQAIRNERERCAKIADRCAEDNHSMAVRLVRRGDAVGHDVLDSCKHEAEAIAAMIRKEES